MFLWGKIVYLEPVKNNKDLTNIFKKFDISVFVKAYAA